LKETILNIYIIIEKENVVSFKAKAYDAEGTDDEKINLLKSIAKADFNSANVFEAPKNNKGKFMEYKKFAKLERQGLQYQLFEEIFSHYQVPQNPLVCVTPVVNGDILAN